MPPKCRECGGKGKHKCRKCGGTGSDVTPPHKSEDDEVHFKDCKNEDCGAGNLEDGMVWCDNCGGRGEVRNYVLIE